MSQFSDIYLYAASEQTKKSPQKRAFFSVQ